jgi:hypothetical protein
MLPVKNEPPVLPCVHSPTNQHLSNWKINDSFFDIYVIVNVGGIVSDFEISYENHYLF